MDTHKVGLGVLSNVAVFNKDAKFEVNFQAAKLCKFFDLQYLNCIHE